MNRIFSFYTFEVHRSVEKQTNQQIANVHPEVMVIFSLSFEIEQLAEK